MDPSTVFTVSKDRQMEKIRPLIKWAGGKYYEYPLFANYIPEFKNYYEPFFGGGGVFFALQPKGQSFLNDKSKELYHFYSTIALDKLHEQLEIYADAWEEAGQLAQHFIDVSIDIFYSYLYKQITYVSMVEQVHVLVDEVVLNTNSLLFQSSFILDPEGFSKQLKNSLTDKFRRIERIAVKAAKSFEMDELPDHIETAVKSALYLFLRKLSNDYNDGKINIDQSKATANWYFVREFCYASMFRFNGRGAFNIPYGGIAYNRKSLREKVVHICSEKVQGLLKDVTFYNLDFAAFLAKTKPQADDFIFIDPPYDSRFSRYDNNAFSQDDQVRLRDCLMGVKAKWMMVIKETPLITSLYNSTNCRLINFDKTYTYNMRGRNKRDASHLIIMNY